MEKMTPLHWLRLGEMILLNTIKDVTEILFPFRDNDNDNDRIQWNYVNEELLERLKK